MLRMPLSTICSNSTVWNNNWIGYWFARSIGMSLFPYWSCFLTNQKVVYPHQRLTPAFRLSNFSRNAVKSCCFTLFHSFDCLFYCVRIGRQFIISGNSNCFLCLSILILIKYRRGTYARGISSLGPSLDIVILKQSISVVGSLTGVGINSTLIMSLVQLLIEITERNRQLQRLGPSWITYYMRV